MNRDKRKPLVAGNWKLNKSLGQSRNLAEALVSRVGAKPACEVAIAPVFTALTAVRDAIAERPIKLAAQDVYWEASGAFTGAVSAPLLKDVGCDYVIVGHSERRQLFAETDDQVRRKLGAVLMEGMAPILCVGETLEQREAGDFEALVTGQVRAALDGVGREGLAKVVIAYEPIWAIGTGKTASPDDAQQVQAAIRRAVNSLADPKIAEGMRILYGGSVKPDNALALLAQPDVDGALVGGASLDAESFAAIVAASA